MNSIGVNDIKTIQLEILKNVHSFCLKNGIKYSLAYGTLLGAVRHKGYIPWDDDIDIMMPRKDYDAFIQMYCNEKYRIANHNTMGSCYLPYSKVYDVRTLVNDYSEYPMEYGVNIDVFPVDNVPDDESELDRLLFKKGLLNRIFDLKIIKLAKGRSFVKNAILAVAHIALSIIPIRKVSEWMVYYSTKYSMMSTERVGIIAPSDNNRREIWSRDLFNEYIILPFENIEVNAITRYHEVLSTFYGDYMQLPSEENRVSHHKYSAYWLD